MNVKHVESLQIYMFSPSITLNFSYMSLLSKHFEMFENRQVRCSSCCRLIESKLKTYTFEKLQKLFMYII